MKTSAVLALIGLATTLTGTALAQGRGGVDQTTKTALLSALDKERLSEAYYKTVTVKFGEAQPFGNLKLAEVNHQNAIVAAMKRYGIVVPPNPYTGGLSNVPNAFSEACSFGVIEEKNDANLLARLANATSVQMVKDLFLNLRSANLERHIPALERGAQNGPCTVSNGQGNRRGNGVCDGTGPKGNAYRKGQGNAGKGNGVCDGTGPKGNGNGGRGNGGSGNGGRGNGGRNGNGGRGGR